MDVPPPGSMRSAPESPSIAGMAPAIRVSFVELDPGPAAAIQPVIRHASTVSSLTLSLGAGGGANGASSMNSNGSGGALRHHPRSSPANRSLSPQNSALRAPTPTPGSGGGGSVHSSPRRPKELMLQNTNGEEPHAVPMPRNIIAVIFGLLVSDYVSPTDTFSQTIRKYCTFMAVLASLTSLFGALDFQEYITHGGAAHLVGALSRFILGVAVSLPVYFLMRHRRHVSDGLAFYMAFGGTLLLGVTSVALPYSSVEAFYTGISVAIVAMDVPFRWLFVAFGALVISIRLANDIWNGALFIPGYHQPSDFTKVQQKYVAVLAYLLTVLIMAHIREKFDAKLAQSKDAAELAASVAGMLAKYDTDAVDAQLAGYRKTPTVDLALCDSLQQICANLKKYRPHLPNYVLPSSVDGAEDEEDENVSPAAGGDGDDASGGGGLLGAPSAGGGRSISSAGGGRMNASSGAPGTNASPHRSTLAVPLAPPPGYAASVTARSDVSSVVDSANIGDVYHGKATVAAVRFRARQVDVFDGRAVNELVLRVNALCRTLGASLHSFVGDTLLVTWNATKRIGKCETKAVNFSWHVVNAANHGHGTPVPQPGHPHLSSPSQSAPPSHLPAPPPPHPPQGGYRGSAAIVTSPVRAFFAGDDSTRVFTVSFPRAQGRLNELSAIASMCAAVVTDAATREHAQFDYGMRAFAVVDPLLGYPTDRFTTDQMAYEVVSERHVDPSKDQEWMYVIGGDAASNDPNDRMTQAVLALGQRKIQEAADLISTLDLSTSSNSAVEGGEADTSRSSPSMATAAATTGAGQSSASYPLHHGVSSSSNFQMAAAQQSAAASPVSTLAYLRHQIEAAAAKS